MSIALSEHLPLLATAPEGTRKLRGLILELAVRGKLVPQDRNDEPASELLKRIAEERARLEAEGICGKLKRLAPVCEEEQPFSLPNSWAWVRFSDVTSYIQRGKGPEYADRSVYVVVSQKCVRWSGLDLAPARFITPESFSKYDPVRLLRRGDILWNSTGTGTIGRAVVVPETIPNQTLVADSHVTVVRSVVTNPTFMWRWIQSPSVQSEIEGSASGSTNQIELATSTVRSHLLPLPPLAEQNRIVAKIDELMALCDRLEAEQTDAEAAHAKLVETLLGTLTQSTDAADLAANWQRLAEHFDTLFTTDSSLDALKQNILQLAVMGKLVPQDPSDEPASELLKKLPRSKTSSPDTKEDEHLFSIPFNWQWTRLGIVFSGGSGTTPSRTRHDYFDGGTERWVKTTDLNNDVVTTCEELITPSAVSDCNLKRYPPGTVCVAMYGGGGTIGKTGVLGVCSTINQSVFALPPVDQVSSAFTHYYLKSIRGVWMKFAAGLRVAANINGQIIKNMVFPLPPLAEQHRIVAKVDELLSLVDRLKAGLIESRIQQERLATTLIESALKAA